MMFLCWKVFYTQECHLAQFCWESDPHKIFKINCETFILTESFESIYFTYYILGV